MLNKLSQYCASEQGQVHLLLFITGFTIGYIL